MNKTKTLTLNDWLERLDEIDENYQQIENVTKFNEGIFYFSYNCINITGLTNLLNKIFKNKWIIIGNDKPKKVTSVFYYRRAIQFKMERIIIHPEQDGRIEMQKRLFSKNLIENAPIIQSLENIQFKKDKIKDIEIHI